MLHIIFRGNEVIKDTIGAQVHLTSSAHNVPQCPTYISD